MLDAVERLGYVPERIAGTWPRPGPPRRLRHPALTNIVFPTCCGGQAPFWRKIAISRFSVTDYEPEREEASSPPSRLAADGGDAAGFEHTEGTLKMLRGERLFGVVELLDIDGAP